MTEEKNGRILCDRPKPTEGCSANGRSHHVITVADCASGKPGDLTFFNNNKITLQMYYKIRCCFVTSETLKAFEAETGIFSRVPFCIAITYPCKISGIFAL